jgi:hypothetical protein
MRPVIDPSLTSRESGEDLLGIQRELAKALSCSIRAVSQETLSQEIGWLLVRLALADHLRRAVEREADQTGTTSTRSA